MHPTELQAYKLKIENSGTEVLNDTLRQIVILGEFPNELLPVIISSLEKGRCIESSILCDILNLTKSLDLYRLTQSKGVLSNWDYIKLLRNGFPTPEIEAILCRELYNCFNNSSCSYRSAIVEAMGEYGRVESGRLLNVIEYELEPTIIDLEYYLETNVEDSSKQLDLSALVSFVKTVKSAKKQIASRTGDSLTEVTTFNKVSESNSQDTTIGFVDTIAVHHKRAHDYLNSDPQSSCNQARKAIEAICKELYKGLESTRKRPADSFKELDELIRDLDKDKVIPDRIIMQIRTIQSFGNFGSHDQGKDGIDFTPLEAETCIKALDLVVDWYSKKQDNK